MKNFIAPIAALQAWYRANCDGQWEHSYGIRIGTIDNPGWNMEIDLTGTALESQPFVPTQVERSAEDWYSLRIVDNKFRAACGPNNLTEAIGLFVAWGCAKLHQMISQCTQLRPMKGDAK